MRCGGTLPFHPEAEAQEAPPSPDALENVVSVSNRGESRPPWLGSVPSGAGRLTRSVGSRAPRRRAPCPPNPPRPQSHGERAGPVCKASGFLREVEADPASSSSPTHPPEAPEGQAPGLGGGRARLTVDVSAGSGGHAGFSSGGLRHGRALSLQAAVAHKENDVTAHAWTPERAGRTLLSTEDERRP